MKKTEQMSIMNFSAIHIEKFPVIPTPGSGLSDNFNPATCISPPAFKRGAEKGEANMAPEVA
jgi:hypothetical protein